MIAALRFASCYAYSPAGAGRMSEHSRVLRNIVKDGDVTLMPRYAQRIREVFARNSRPSDFFGASTVLVPVPRSVPESCGREWIAQNLAIALITEGLGSAVWAGLHRMRAVRKSATALAGKRPSVLTHYASFAIERSATRPRRILLIDDVVTKGRTLIAAASRVQEMFPDAEIRAFALLRTIGWVEDIVRLLDPCEGEIRWLCGDAHRSP